MAAKKKVASRKKAARRSRAKAPTSSRAKKKSAKTKTTKKKTTKRKVKARAKPATSSAGAAAKAKAKSTSKVETPTIVYIHGLANKPEASVLKCQWDTALFGNDMGDRTRMAYWVDREVHPQPENATCTDADIVPIPPEDQEPEGAGIRSARFDDDWLEREVEELGTSKAERAFLKKMGSKLVKHGDSIDLEESKRGPGVKALPLPGFLRRRITRAVTKQFLRDAFNFFFRKEKRERMEDVLRERLIPCEGPVIVIAHSQGSMIAYDLLRQLDKNDVDVSLLLTIGSPLGLTEIKDLFKSELIKNKKLKLLPKPKCVTRWVNVADKADVVATDETLSSEFEPGNFIEDIPAKSKDRKRLNKDSPKHPHSATGYLRSDVVQELIRDTVGTSFGSFLSDFVIARDLSSAIEDDREGRHRVLIQLSEVKKAGAAAASLDAIGQEILEKVATTVIDSEKRRGSGSLSKEAALTLANVDVLKRWVAAELTAAEIESLKASHKSLPISRLWRNTPKAILLDCSGQAIQVEPARIGYRSRGKGITWAVLDTGIDDKHPHFKRKDGKCIKEAYDCTGRGRPNPKNGKYRDGHGHGTHVAGIIAGEGEETIESDEGKKAKTQFCGMAPDTQLVIYKVLSDSGEGQDSWIIKALEDIARKNEDAGKLVIQGVNLSLGGPFDPSVYGCGHSPLCQELRRLWRQGVIVCLAAGNEGFAQLQSSHGLVDTNVDLSIGDPANLEEAIAVGSVHKKKPHKYGVSFFSSRGPTADGRIKPDLVAPGEKILSARARVPANGARKPLYVAMDGTSMATPHVSGLLAAFLSARSEFIGYPEHVKEILLANCTDLGRDRYIQGHGLPNLIKMLANT